MACFKFDLDAVTLIELVKSKNCLWDKTNINNKNKIHRERSWQEIFQTLVDGYDQLSQLDKNKTSEIIINKWANIRDSFLRSLRPKCGQSAKKSYLYSEHLQFLLKFIQKDNAESNNFSQDEEFSESPAPNPQLSVSKSSSLAQPVASTSRGRRQASNKGTKSKRKSDVIESEILTEPKKAKQLEELHAQSDQEMLLLSFLPYTRDMSEAELMDLQIEILTTIKKIKQRRGSNQQFFTSPSSFIPLQSPEIDNADFYQISQQSVAYESPSPSDQMEDNYLKQELPQTSL